jgi:peroxiredoxin Q/BCP
MLEWLFADPLPVGSLAPDFTLVDDRGNSVRLGDFRGKKSVVLVWYPGDDTRICTQQLCELRDAWTGLEAADVVVFGVNPQSGEKHAAFRSRHAFPFPLLVDAGQKAGRAYHTYGWIVRRTVYAIDKKGVIRLAQRGKPSPELVLEALR